MKPKGFIHILVLVLVTSALVLPNAGCFGDYKGMSRNDDAVFGATFGGYWGIGLAVGLFIQFSPRWSIAYDRLAVDGTFDSNEIQVSPEGSGMTYLEEQNITVALMHDDVHHVMVELAIPGDESGRFVLPAGELDAPWAAIDVNGQRFVTSDEAQVVVSVKRDAGEMVAEFSGQMQAEDGTLRNVSGSFIAIR